MKAGRYVTAKGLFINDLEWVDFIHDFFLVTEVLPLICAHFFVVFSMNNWISN